MSIATIIALLIALAAPIASADTWRLTVTGDGAYANFLTGETFSTGPATATPALPAR